MFLTGETEVLEENPVPEAHRCNLADIIVGGGGVGTIDHGC